MRSLVGTCKRPETQPFLVEATHLLVFVDAVAYMCNTGFYKYNRISAEEWQSG